MSKRTFKFSRQYMHTFAIDFTLARGPIHRISSHFRYGKSKAESVAQFNPIQQQYVVHKRTQRETAHHRSHPKHLWVLVVVHCRNLMFLHERNERMKEVTEDPPLGAEIGGIGGETVDYHSLRLELLHQLFDVVKMHVHFDFLRGVVFQMDETAIDV